MTGHLVLSTLHTNDAAGAVTRLVDMGVEPFLIASAAMIGVLAQRLVRDVHRVRRAAPDCQTAARMRNSRQRPIERWDTRVLDRSPATRRRPQR